MPTYQKTPQLEHGHTDVTGILLVNLGTPDAPTTASVRRFLRQFLSDPRVVEYPRLLWWFILNFVILRFRPSRSAAAYRKVWTDQGSPLLLHSAALGNALQQHLDALGEQTVHVALAMNYGNPSIASAIDKLLTKGAGRILTLPLYPQYSATTTASVFDTVARKFTRLRAIPEARFINDYHDAPGYIAALANSVRTAWAQRERSSKLLMSFHGIPRKMILSGDPYQQQCERTARLLANALQLGDDDWMLTYQSRVGREDWLSPYTDQTLKALGAKKLASIDVVCPGFSTDCLETLEEIAIQNSENFTAAGGGSLHYIPALNARADHVRFLTDLISQHVTNWGSGDVMESPAIALKVSAAP